MTDARPGLADRMSLEVVKPPSIIALMRKQATQVEEVLPSHLKGNGEAYVRAAITLIKHNPTLANCDQLSILGGLMTASALGLELGPLQVAYLVPYKGQAQLQIGYRGYIELAFRSGMMKDITAEDVRENDTFSFDRASGEIHHSWDLKVERGPAYAYYAVANFKNGGRAFVVLSKHEIDKYRKRSQAKDGPAWTKDFDAMARKTCIRRLEPFLPKSTAIARAFSLDGSVSVGEKADAIEVTPADYEQDDEIVEAEVVTADGEIKYAPGEEPF